MFEKIDEIILRVCILFVFITCIIIGYKITFANGQIEYCYIASHIDSGGQVHVLYGSRDWRPDQTIMRETVYPTHLTEYTKEIGCPLKLTM